MKRIATILSLIVSMVIINSCNQTKNNSVLENANYNLQQHNLVVDYQLNPDTSLLQIIEFSDIRKSGYGILLNIDNNLSKTEMDELKLKFQKLDINAIHSFNVSLTDTLDSKVRIAMEGAKFVWILKNKDTKWKSMPIRNEISNLQNKTEQKILVVLN